MKTTVKLPSQIFLTELLIIARFQRNKDWNEAKTIALSTASILNSQFCSQIPLYSSDFKENFKSHDLLKYLWRSKANTGVAVLWMLIYLPFYKTLPLPSRAKLRYRSDITWNSKDLNIYVFCKSKTLFLSTQYTHMHARKMCICTICTYYNLCVQKMLVLNYIEHTGSILVGCQRALRYTISYYTTVLWNANYCSLFSPISLSLFL